MLFMAGPSGGVENIRPPVRASDAEREDAVAQLRERGLCDQAERLFVRSRATWGAGKRWRDHKSGAGKREHTGNQAGTGYGLHGNLQNNVLNLFAVTQSVKRTSPNSHI